MYNDSVINGTGRNMMNNPMNGNSYMADVFFAKISGDNILQQGYGPNQNTVVGYTVKAYDEAIHVAEEYRELLIKHGIIEKEKTPEELAQEQKGIMEQMLHKMDTVLDKVGDFESGLDDIDRRITELEGRNFARHNVQEAGSHEIEHPEDTSAGIKPNRGRSAKTE